MDKAKERIKDHYKNPRNYGKPNFHVTHEARIENLACGDMIHMYLRISDSKLGDVSFEGEGCSICIATGSLLTEQIKDKHLDEVEQIGMETMLNDLGIQINESRMQCVGISIEALKRALSGG